MGLGLPRRMRSQVFVQGSPACLETTVRFNMGVSVTEVEISEFVSAASLLATYPSYVNPIQVP